MKKALSPRIVAFRVVASLVLFGDTTAAEAQDVLFSQPYTSSTSLTSIGSDVDLPSEVADNFSVAAGGAVSSVRWWGKSVQDGTTFRVRFFADQAGTPATVAFYDEIVTPTVQPSSSLIAKLFTADLSSTLQFAAGTTYYFSVVENVIGNNSPLDGGWYWGFATSGSDSAYWKRPSVSDPWVAQTGGVTKLAFELLGATRRPDVSIVIAATPDPV
jgi:hypothetical protein